MLITCGELIFMNGRLNFAQNFILSQSWILNFICLLSVDNVILIIVL